ncbi:penicillin binding protein PBP4B [Alishewanella jeotgali]|uniref:N-acetylmuramyl-L-alanine amidase, negative regulator of AmpC, AmpD n=1 Tax=Alishewanella jeotgali KCTC 22429 TaxID=1129374 RepID=H3ZH65_9ALTE|nr:penicillin binding protein PBP4B [Alishewanella jeotgali]EHR40072.1 N-acetylmuramyl-L-alanine amidase, negative regulator of AmpC, AmpD [Alishewanella jeotgali KCTC 22429]
MLGRLLFSGCLLLSLVACSLSPQAPSRTVSAAEQLVLAEQRGQLVLHWPEQRSERVAVNNKRRFLAYAGQGEMLVDLQQAQQLSLQVNGKTLTLHATTEHKPLRVDLSRLTRNGENRLELISVSPADAKVLINIPYPTLRTNLEPYTAAFAQVDQLIEQEIAKGFPGAVLLVVKDGVIIKHSAYGYAERYRADGSLLSQPRGMQTDTLFDIASNSKMYATNYALMRLVSEGKLDVTKPVQHYLPEYQGDGREQRTVSDLLYHTAGYAPEVHFFRPDNRHGPQFYSLNKADTEQLILTQVPFATERGVAAVYSDVDYMLLGMLIERLSGQPLDQYLREQFYQPLGLFRTLFNPLQHGFTRDQIAATELDGNSRGGRVSFPANRSGVIVGEVHDEKAFYSFQGVAGHAGLFSTAEELAVLMALSLQGGGYGWQQFFTPATLAQFKAPSPYDHRFGLGWRTAVQGDLNWHFGAYASDSAYGHTGWTGTATVIDPEQQLLVVLLTNKKHSPIVAEGESYYFSGDRFETGRYGSILTLIYQALP